MARIHGETSYKRHREIEMDMGGGQRVTVRLTYPPFDFGERLATCLPIAPCRQIPLRDGKGVVFDRKTGKPIWYDDPTDQADFAARSTDVELLRGIVGFRMIMDDPHWEIDAKQPENGAKAGEWMAYAIELRAELNEVGFTSLGYRTIAEAMGEMGGMTETQIAEAAADFTRGTEKTPASETERGPSSTPPKKRAAASKDS